MRNPESYDQMLATLRQVWASHLIAVRLKQPGLGALLSHRVYEAIKAGERVSPTEVKSEPRLLSKEILTGQWDDLSVER